MAVNSFLTFRIVITGGSKSYLPFIPLKLRIIKFQQKFKTIKTFFKMYRLQCHHIVVCTYYETLH